MVSINYVIATWTGPRRRGNDAHCKDNVYYLKEHLRILQKFNHNLSQITIVAPNNPAESKEVSCFIEDCEGELGGVPVVVMRRENRGHSYGSYSFVYSKFRQAFDYYIFIEDDYVMPLHHFDSKLVNLFENKKNCGFLCGLVTPFGDEGKPHAAISNGLSSSEVLEKVFTLKGELPSSNFTTTYHCQSQLQFSWAFLEAGYKLHHVIPNYSVVFNDIGKCHTYGTGEPIMIPLQFKSSYKVLS